ncbi:ArpA protein [Pseudomonas sp. CM25]|uniref:HalD/BesD family halogenase n=1 Tax=Pseudomonas sp. CM25 TaxID=2738448 RepID=UPI0015536FC3|nr:ArpA protein [Pseudomonas sp. CM25]NQD56492.1 ArpA protein [Pseudomonas sp. CM25]
MSVPNADHNHANILSVLEENPFSERDFFWERHKFEKDGYLKINDLVGAAIKELIAKDVKNLLLAFSKRREFLIESTGNTPRYLSNVPQECIEQNGQWIPLVYNSNYMSGLIEAIVGESVIPTPWKWDNYIINCQHKEGDTHGWHWGDYPYTIIWVVEAPQIECGGLLECVPHTRWDKKNPRVENLLVKNKIDSYFHEAGDVYLLKADTTLHRVKPLTVSVDRVILNTTWERAKDKDRLVEHETFVFRD